MATTESQRIMGIILQNSVPRCLNKTEQILFPLKLPGFFLIIILLCLSLIAKQINKMVTLLLLLHIMVNTVTQCFRVFNLEHEIRVVVHWEKLNTIFSSFFHVLYFWPCKSFLTQVHQLSELHLHTCGSTTQSMSRTFLQLFKLVHLAFKQK